MNHELHKTVYQAPITEVYQAVPATMLMAVSGSFGEDNGHYAGSNEEEDMEVKNFSWEEEEL